MIDDQAPGEHPGSQTAPLHDDPTHTDSGAPTDEAHADVGDGTLVGSIPAGIGSEELEAIVKSNQPVEGGTS